MKKLRISTVTSLVTASVILISPAMALAREAEPDRPVPSTSSSGNRQSPDAADRNYETAVESGAKKYTGADGRQHDVTQRDIKTVATRKAYRSVYSKHLSNPYLPPDQEEAIRSQQVKSVAAARNAKIKDARKQYQKEIKERVKKAESKRIASAKEYKKNSQELQKQRNKVKKELDKLRKKLKKNGTLTDAESVLMNNYTIAQEDILAKQKILNAYDDSLKIVQSASTKNKEDLYGMIETTFKVDRDNLKPGDFERYRDTLESTLKYNKGLIEDQKKALEQKNKANETAYQGITEKLKANHQAFTDYEKKRDEYRSISTKMSNGRANYLSLNAAQKRAVRLAIAAGTDKPAVLKEAESGDNTPGQKAGTGSPSAASTKAPDGKVDSATFANAVKRPSNHAEGDILVLTYIDTPGNKDKTDQRIGSVRVKVDKVQGDADCDTHKDGDAKTNSTRFVTSKKTGKKKFVKGSANFKNCAPGTYKVTFVGRDGYKLREGEDRVQTVSVKDDHTTEVVFTLVKSSKK